MTAALLTIAGLLAGLAPHESSSVRLPTPQSFAYLHVAWLFQPGDDLRYADPAFDDRAWQEVSLPREGRELAAAPELGWYRLEVDVNEAAAAANHVLALGPVREAAEVYLNGMLVAQRGWLADGSRGQARLEHLVVPIAAGLLRPGRNVLAVRVHDPSGGGGLVAGPLALGSPTAVGPRVAQAERWPQALTLALTLVALLDAALAFAVALRRGGRGQLGGLVGAGLALALVVLSGLGLQHLFVPSLELAVRLPLVAAAMVVWFLWLVIVRYYGDPEALGARVALGLQALVAVALLVIPSAWAFQVAGPVLLGTSLAASLSCSHVLYAAIRRRDEGAIGVFGGVIALVCLLIYDGMTYVWGNPLPAASFVGAVGVLTVLSWTIVGTALAPPAAIDLSPEPARWGVLESIAAATSAPERFLLEVVRDVAERFDVRRCSVLLADDDGKLRVRAAQGLPREALQVVVSDPASISSWAYRHNCVLTVDNLPEEVEAARGEGRYVTRDFVVAPIAVDARVLGVLTVSDRDDARPFSSDDARRVAEAAAHLGMALALLGRRAAQAS